MAHPLKTLAFRFLSFERMLGRDLTRVVYYLGLLLIILGVIWVMVTGLGSLFSDFFHVIGVWIGAPLAGLVSIILWRLACERMYIWFRDHAEPPEPAEDDDAEAGDESSF